MFPHHSMLFLGGWIWMDMGSFTPPRVCCCMSSCYSVAAFFFLRLSLLSLTKGMKCEKRRWKPGAAGESLAS